MLTPNIQRAIVDRSQLSVPHETEYSTIVLTGSVVEARHDPRDSPGEVPLHAGTNDGGFRDQQHHRSTSASPGAYLQLRE